MTGDPRSVVFGLDGGATITRAVVVDATGALLWQGRSTGTSLTRRGIKDAAALISDLLGQAREEVEAFDRRLCGIAAGFAGGRSRTVQMEMGTRLADLWADSDTRQEVPVTVTHDAHIALLGALGPSGEGCIVISGTGSICMARDKQGMTTLTGGWGWPLGDEGSAVWLGWQTVRRALAAWEEGHPTPLAAHILEQWQIDPDEAGDPHVLMRHAARAMSDPEIYATLAQGVFTSAADGDPDALQLVRTAGYQLGVLVGQACSRLGLGGGREVPLSLRGTLAETHAAVLGPAIREGAGTSSNDLRFTPAQMPAEGGAALLALAAAGFEPDEEISARLAGDLVPGPIIPPEIPARH